MIVLNQETQSFIEDLKKDSNVIGIVLFGSWARGNNRPDSDVDLVVILKEGYKRAVEYRGKQAFEIIHTTEKGAFDFWESNKDDAAGLWEVARILYDREGTVAALERRTKEILSAGKNPVDDFQKGQLRFDAEDILRYVEQTFSTDPASANLLLTNKVFALTETFFDLRRLWTPAPKQRLSKICEISPDFCKLLVEFYRSDISFEARLDLARRMMSIIFDL